MRAALLQSEGSLVMAEVDRPAIEDPNEALIRVRTVGVCGSEVHAFQGTHPFRKAPVILGHEMAGEVVAVGDVVTRVAIGDRVVVDPQRTCGSCVHCLTGDINLCPEKKVLGTGDWSGAFGEYVVAPEEAIFRLPDNLSYRQGSLIEPLTVAAHVTRMAGLQEGMAVAILGSGSIGGMVSGVCSAKGADPIVVADVREHCLVAARERMGATHDILLELDKRQETHEALVDEVLELTDGQGVDVSFITADDPRLVNAAIGMARRRGRIVLVALLTEAPLQFDAYPIIGRELRIIGSLMCNHADVRTAIDLVGSGRVDVEGVLTHVLPIEEAQRGMELAQTKEDNAIKVVLRFS